MILNSKKVKSIIKYIKKVNDKSKVEDLLVYIRQANEKVQFIASNAYVTINAVIKIDSDESCKIIWPYRDIEKIMNIKSNKDIEISQEEIMYDSSTIKNSMLSEHISNSIEKCVSKAKTMTSIKDDCICFNISKEDTKKLKDIKKFCSASSTKPILDGINLFNGTAVGLDGYRISTVKLSDNNEKNITIDKYTVDILSLIAYDFNVKCDGEKIKFQTIKDDVVVIVTTRVLEGSFTRCEFYYSEEGFNSCFLNVESLYNYLYGVVKASKDKSDNSVCLKFSKDKKLTVVNKYRDQRISIDYTSDKPLDVIVYLNSIYLKDALLNIKEATIVIKDSASQVIIKTENNEVKNLVLPIRNAKGYDL